MFFLSILAIYGVEASQSLSIFNVIRAYFDKKIIFKASFLLVKTNQVKLLDFYVLIVYICICQSREVGS